MGWILPHTSRALRRWRARALAAADDSIREDIVSALRDKRPQSEGAALLAILAPNRCSYLLAALLCYQIIWDGLDSIHERAPNSGNGLQLHHAVTDALRPWRPLHAYYKMHERSDDCGYLAALVSCCRESITHLPSFAAVQPLILREAATSRPLLVINHEPCDSLRKRDMRSWAAREQPRPLDARWFERGAASGAALTTFAALTQAAAPKLDVRTLKGICRTYPWAAVVATMLDSYADRIEDCANGDHVYIDYYETLEEAVRRTGEMTRHALVSTCSLDDPFRPRIVIASMVAMYLTKDDSRTSSTRDHLRHISRSAGSLTRLLMPAVRLWRILYSLRSS